MSRARRRKPNIDGVVQRQQRSRLGNFETKSTIARNPSDGLHSFKSQKAPADSVIQEEFRELNSMKIDPEPKIKGKRRLRLRRNRRQPKFRQKAAWTPWRVFKRVALFASVAVVLIVGGLALKFYIATQNIIDRNGDGALALQENIDPSQLNGEGDGRVNILLIGIGGEGHPAPDLSDTLIVASIDPFNNEVAMLSIPRDLYVDVPGAYSTRINAAHAIGNEQGFEEGGYPDDGIGLLQKTVEQTLDIPIHYYVRVDFTAFEQAIDAVGGVTVDVQEAVYDPTFWWEWGILDIPVGPYAFDGETALFYVRSRQTSPGGDFDRSQRQRELLVALKDKVLSAGTYTNPLRISSLIDAVGNHVRTNLQVSELLRVQEIMNDIPAENIVSVGLSTESDNFLTGANIGGASVLVPVDGDFAAIQKFVRELFVDGFIRSEAAQVDVFNGSGLVGAASEQAELLRSFGYQVATVGDAPSNNLPETVLYDLSDGEKPFTKRLLEQRYGSNARPGSQLPSGIASEADFVVVLGQDN